MLPLGDQALSEPLESSRKKIHTKTKFKHHGDKVKQVRLHSTEPWILTSMYNGKAELYNYETQTLEKTFEVSKDHLRAGIFMENRNWAVFGGDDKSIKAYNYNTQEIVFQSTEHTDFVRHLLYIEIVDILVSCSDDKSIIVWDLEVKGIVKKNVLKEHTHFVMGLAHNPKDSSVFASASLDGTIKLWNVNSQNSHMTLSGHQKGVNCVCFFEGDRTLLLSGGDDNLILLWDYQVINTTVI